MPLIVKAILDDLSLRLLPTALLSYNGTVSARQEMEAAPLRQIGENLIKEGVASESNSTSHWAADAFTSGKQSLAHGISISGNKMAAS
ncbi:hypothetical protein J7T55_011702 [Diaporthe amygdali]|uniref:uncharacterized protein n=1 Tax=Phomopsis amygdali TaxID=1214568 RepID=UPI0022FE71CA|nr:uncharacterized protein J7T55_011702 [Diaporthe amygdali]KAJ0123238.1 hypothetical protein J7T55_011702 [Diaporthe amygdali]